MEEKLLHDGLPLGKHLLREYFRSALVPLVLACIGLLALYFGMNRELGNMAGDILRRESVLQMTRIVREGTEKINDQLKDIRVLTTLAQSRAVHALGRKGTPKPEETYAVSAEGMLYKNEGEGCSLFYSALHGPDGWDMDAVRQSAALDPFFLDILRLQTDVLAVYYNSRDSLCRYCPFTLDPLASLPPRWDARDYPFFYLADEDHDPGHVPVWTGVYDDPAGLGWMISCVAPVWIEGRFLGVVGLDYGLQDLVSRAVSMDLPWGMQAMLLDKQGNVLVAPQDLQDDFGLPRGTLAGGYGYSVSAGLDMTNLSDPDASRAFKRLLGMSENTVSVTVRGRRLILAQDVVGETGWRFVMVADEDRILTPARSLDDWALTVGLRATGLLFVFGALFWGLLAWRMRVFSRRISAPLWNMAKATTLMADGEYAVAVSESTGIEELDSVARDFNEMARQVRGLDRDLRRSNEELEEHSRNLEALVAQRTEEVESALTAVQSELEERRKVEAVLEERTLFLSALMDAVPLPCFFKDREGAFLGCNQAFSEFFGISDEDVTGLRELPPSGSGPAQSLDQMDHVLLRDEAGSVSYEGEVHDTWGNQRSALFSKSTYNDASGNLAGIVGVMTDITEQKQAEADLRESEQNMRRVLEGIRAAIFVIDPDGFRLKDMNSRAEELLGVRKGEYLGRGCCDLPWEKGGCESGECPLLRGELFNREMLLKRPDGSVIPIIKTVISARIRGVIHLFEIVFDITERKDIERQLAQAQKMESIGQLAAGIAHEINTPTQYIGDNIWFLRQAFERFSAMLTAYAELCEALRVAGGEGAPAASMEPRLADLDAVRTKSKVDFLLSQVPKAIEQSLDGVTRVSTIVQAMKKFSHPDAGEKAATDLNAAVENTVTVARNEWKYVAEVETDLAPDLPPVPCFPGEINQVLLNILVNAAHAIGDVVKDSGEKGRIGIRTRRKDENWAEIRISDTGTGIPEANLQKIFDPFFTTKQVGKGTGQGLSIVYNSIVKNHGGRVDVESREGEGSTFIILLPVTPGESGNE